MGSYTKELQRIRSEISQKEQELKIIGEDLAYNIKIYFRNIGTTMEAWCKDYNVSYRDLQDSLKNESPFELNFFLNIILTGKKTTPVNAENNFIWKEFEKSNVGVSSILKALKTEDARKLWAAVSYYILMNHKNIQKFCEDMKEENFNVKYSTFRTDKYNRGFNTAVKYANIILEYTKNK